MCAKHSWASNSGSMGLFLGGCFLGRFTSIWPLIVATVRAQCILYECWRHPYFWFPVYYITNQTGHGPGQYCP